SSVQLNLARALSRKHGVEERCTFVEGELSKGPSLGQFDLILNQDFIEHIHPDETDEVVSAAFELLRPGGYLVTDTPSRISGPHDVSRYFLERGTPAAGFHLREFSVSELAALYKRHGFEDIRAPISHPKVCRSLRLFQWSPLFVRQRITFERTFEV